MRFIGAEDADRTPWLFAVQAVGVGVMAGAFIMVTQYGLHIVQRHFLLWRHEDREFTSFGHILVYGRIELFLDGPYARVVIRAVTLVITGIGFGEVEFAIFCRFVQTLFGRKLNQVF